MPHMHCTSVPWGDLGGIVLFFHENVGVKYEGDYDHEYQREVLSLGSSMGFYHGLAQVYFEVSWEAVHLSIKGKWLKYGIMIMSYVDLLWYDAYVMNMLLTLMFLS